MKNKAKDNRCFTISRFKCECGNELTVPRMKYGKRREKGNLKDLWCPFCKEIKTMKEVLNCDYVRNGLGELIG